MNSKTEKPVLFVLLSRFPYPLEKGDKLRAYYQLRELALSYQIVLICLTDTHVPEKHLEKVRSFCMDIKVFKLSKSGIYRRLFLNTFSHLPFQVAYFHSYRIQKKIKALLNQYRPQHIYCQLIRTSEYIKNYHDCSKTIDYMDALSIGMERRAQRSKGPMKLLFQEEAKRLRNYERKVFDYFEGHTIISEQDRSFIVHPDRQQIKIVPNGIDLSFFEEIETTAEFDLVFIGNLSYPPNIEAATFLSKNLLPKLPGKKLLLAGATPDPELERLTSRTENITLLGWTDDIRSTYKRGKVFIAPMHIGTGMQNKLLEAMALGIPCITTTLANNAIKGVHRQHLIVADTEKEMIHAIEELLINMELRNKLAVNAQNFVRSNYSWSSTANELEKILKRQG